MAIIRADAPTHPLRAAAWMTGSILGFSAVAIAGRQIGTSLDTFEIMAYRSAIGVVTVLLVAVALGKLHEITFQFFRLHVLRNAVHFAGQNLWLYALLYIPMAQLFALEFSYPILVALAAPLLLGERLTPTRLISAMIGFAGILIVARPFAEGALSWGLIAALLCALGFAGSAIVTKHLTRRVSLLCILFWLALMQLTFGVVLAAMDGVVALPRMPELPWVVMIGFAGLGAHFCLTRALSLAPASVVTPIDFLRLPLIAVIGWLFYTEPFDLWILTGGAVIFFGNWLNIRAEARQARIPLVVPHSPAV